MFLQVNIGRSKSTDQGHPESKDIQKNWPMWQTHFTLAIPKNLQVGVNYFPYVKGHWASVVRAFTNCSPDLIVQSNLRICQAIMKRFFWKQMEHHLSKSCIHTYKTTRIHFATWLLIFKSQGQLKVKIACTPDCLNWN